MDARASMTDVTHVPAPTVVNGCAVVESLAMPNTDGNVPSRYRVICRETHGVFAGLLTVWTVSPDATAPDGWVAWHGHYGLPTLNRARAWLTD